MGTSFYPNSTSYEEVPSVVDETAAAAASAAAALSSQNAAAASAAAAAASAAAAVLGGGDVSGPSSATDNAVALFSGTTGKLLRAGAALATVATSGAYTDLSGKPTLATVSATGAYSDLSGRPSLGGAAALNVGTTTGTVAAGDDSRVTGAAQKASNLSDLASAPTARTNLGLSAVAASGAYADLSGGPPLPPQGRLTLTSGTSVPTTDVTSATTVYYTPAVGKFVPLWNGSTLVMANTGGELSQATTDTTKSPAAVTTNSNYDMFVWSDSGTIRCTRGPAWTSDTARGTGAGTTELDFTTSPGTPINKNTITNGPAAGRGTYVGTFRSNGTSTIDFGFGTAALGGGTANLNVWNLYNQVLMRGYVSDSTATWTYSANTVRALNASNGNRVNFISGLAQQVIYANLSVHVVFATAAGAFYAPGIGLDSTTAYNFLGQFTNSAATASVKMVPPVFGTYSPQVGFHFIQALEFGDGTNTNTLDQSRVGNGAGLQVLMAM